MRVAFLVLVLAGCGRVDFDPSAPCSEPWSTPREVPLGLPLLRHPSISSDDLELYVDDYNLGPNLQSLMVARRALRTDAFPPATMLPSPPNSVFEDAMPTITGDGLHLLFTQPQSSQAFIVQTDRTSTSLPFTKAARNVVATGTGDISSDGLALYGSDFGAPILVYTRPDTMSSFTSRPPFASVAFSGNNSMVSISTDQRVLYFTAPDAGQTRIWIATRPPIQLATDEFTEVAVVDAVPAGSDYPEISADGHHLYFILGPTLMVVSRCEY